MQNASVAPREAANYFEKIRRFPMLKAEDEYALAARWRDTGDASAAHRVLISHLRLVVKVAMDQRKRGVDLSDSISSSGMPALRSIQPFIDGGCVKARRALPGF
jgi:RNA polymerase sigma-32 factor